MTDASGQGRKPAGETVARTVDLDAMAQEFLDGPADGASWKGAVKGVLEVVSAAEQRRINKAAIDQAIAAIDRQLSAQVDAILHAPDVQKIESAWRGIRFLVDRTDFRQNVQIELLQATKDELRNDFDDATEVVQSGLYRHVYKREFGQFGGNPVGTIVGLYEFDAGAEDVGLLRKVASVGAMAHAPFISAASPRFFGDDKDLEEDSKRTGRGLDMRVLERRRDLADWFAGRRFDKWRSFRETCEDARYVGLTAPRFLLRVPYGRDARARTFDYSERIDAHGDYLWGNSAIAFASRLTDAFAKYRWCANVIGPKGGGTVEDLPLHQYEAMGAVQTKPPTEILLDHRRDFELTESGFISLVMRKHTDNACFFAAPSVTKPKTFGSSKAGKEAEAGERLGAQIPYLMIVNRLAHYVKVLQTEKIGSNIDRQSLEAQLNSWIGDYVLKQELMTPEQLAKYPLRSADIKVADVEGEPGWYRVTMKVMPQFKYMGAHFELSLVGKHGAES